MEYEHCTKIHKPHTIYKLCMGKKWLYLHLQRLQNWYDSKLLQKNKKNLFCSVTEAHCRVNHVVWRRLQHVHYVCCRAPLHKGCPKHQGHKGDPEVTPGTCGANGEKAQVILVWVRAPGVGNASHPQRLGGMRVRP